MSFLLTDLIAPAAPFTSSPPLPPPAISGPGDMLYIPPFYFHHVSVPHEEDASGDPPACSLSVSTHTESVDVDILEGTSSLGAPIWGGMTHSQRVAILGMYVRRVLEETANIESGKEEGGVRGPGEDEGATVRSWTPRSFVQALLETRFNHLHADEEEGGGGGVSGLVAAMTRATAHFRNTTFVLPPPSKSIVEVVESRVKQFSTWRRSRIRVSAGAHDSLQTAECTRSTRTPPAPAL